MDAAWKKLAFFQLRVNAQDDLVVLEFVCMNYAISLLRAPDSSSYRSLSVYSTEQLDHLVTIARP